MNGRPRRSARMWPTVVLPAPMKPTSTTNATRAVWRNGLDARARPPHTLHPHTPARTGAGRRSGARAEPALQLTAPPRGLLGDRRQQCFVPRDLVEVGVCVELWAAPRCAKPARSFDTTSSAR